MMTSSTSETLDDLRRLVGAAGTTRPQSGVFLEVMFGARDAGEAEGLFYDAEGNDRTGLLRALVERLDETTKIARSLAERVAVLERIVVQDEARLALEIEKLRAGGA